MPIGDQRDKGFGRHGEGSDNRFNSTESPRRVPYRVNANQWTRGRKLLLLLLALAAVGLGALIHIWSRPDRVSAEATLLPGNAAQLSPVLLRATNHTSSNFAFCCFLEIKIKSGWI